MTADRSQVVVAYCTVPDVETGKRLARLVVEGKLAACVNLVPGLTSIYRWQGAVSEDAEVLLIIKTRASLVEPLTHALTAAHPYSVPEVITLPVTGGNAPYLAWVRESTVDP